MTKADIINNVSKETGFTKVEVENQLDSIIFPGGGTARTFTWKNVQGGVHFYRLIHRYPVPDCRICTLEPVEK